MVVLDVLLRGLLPAVRIALGQLIITTSKGWGIPLGKKKKKRDTGNEPPEGSEAFMKALPAFSLRVVRSGLPTPEHSGSDDSDSEDSEDEDGGRRKQHHVGAFRLVDKISVRLRKPLRRPPPRRRLQPDADHEYETDSDSDGEDNDESCCAGDDTPEDFLPIKSRLVVLNLGLDLWVRLGPELVTFVVSSNKGAFTPVRPPTFLHGTLLPLPLAPESTASAAVTYRACVCSLPSQRGQLRAQAAPGPGQRAHLVGRGGAEAEGARSAAPCNHLHWPPPSGASALAGLPSSP